MNNTKTKQEFRTAMNTKIAGRLPADQELLDEKRAFRSRALQGMQALLDSHLTDKGETELQNALYELDRLNDEIDELADKGETELQNALYELDRLNDEIDELADKGVKPQES